jgi:hypothetical protein
MKLYSEPYEAVPTEASVSTRKDLRIVAAGLAEIFTGLANACTEGDTVELGAWGLFIAEAEDTGLFMQVVSTIEAIQTEEVGLPPAGQVPEDPETWPQYVKDMHKRREEIDEVLNEKY